MVVVSEEKGAISLCFGGNIVRGLDGQALRDALFGLFYKPKAETKKNPDERMSVVPESVVSERGGSEETQTQEPSGTTKSEAEGV